MVYDRLPARPRLSFLFRQLHQHYAEDIDATLRDAGFGDVNPGHAKVFPFVPPEGIQVGELADLAGVRKQTMAEAVDQLVRAGYLERRPNPMDARSRLIFLTKRGESARPVAIAAGQRVEEGWAELTSPEQIETVRQHLRHLLEKINQRPTG
jgi:DNA-binding MarR family transcriptional regulator